MKSPLLARNLARLSGRTLSRDARQQGIALVIVLIISALAGLIAVTQAGSLTALFRSSGDEFDLSVARQAAEAALRDAESDIVCLKWDAPTKAWLQVLAGSSQPNNHCVSVAPHCSQMMPVADAPGIRLLGANPIGPPAAVDWSAPGVCIDGNCAIEFGAKTGALPMENVIAQPRYHVEVFDVGTSGTGEPVPLFRITARGFGSRAETVFEVQEVFRPCR